VSDAPSFLAAAMRFSAPARVEVLDASSATSLREADRGAMCVSAVGAITADRSVHLPAIDGATYVCENATTGGHSVAFRTSSAAGVSLAAGEIALVRCSGVTYARVGAAGGGSSTPDVQTHTVAGDATLSSTEAAADLLVLDGTPGAEYALTFPTSTRDGAPITIVNMSDSGVGIFDHDRNDFGVAPGGTITFQRAFAKLLLVALAPTGGDSTVLRGNGFPGTVPAAALPSSVVQAGAAPAIDASHLHVYACGETSGMTLADTGSGTQVAATLLGSAGVAYALGSPRPFARGTKGLRLLADTLAHGAQVTVTGMGIGAYTIECFGLIDEYVASSPTVDMLVTVDDGSGNNAIHFGVISTGLVFGGTVIGGSDRNTTTSHSQAAQPVQLGVPAHWMAVYDPTATPTFRLYRNGTIVADNNQQSGAMASLSRITIGNRGALDAGARGAIAQVRVSNVARSAAYAVAVAEALFAL